ncbi:Predicted Zn-dependent peptidase [Micrococcales bacterium KH10]|nr:Predicted Zn-dependent peptidase [Micrococcales bacterium KH10]
MPWQLPIVAATDDAAALTAGQDGVTIRRSVLPGGVRVLTESVPGVRSVSIGFWVPVGSRDETDGHYGSTHFLEHLLFKGTSRRSAAQIAEAFDAVGGESNAATSKEHTCYYARVLDADLDMAVDVLADMVTSATLDPADFEMERQVIIEELAMTEDDPADVAHEAFSAAVLSPTALARPIGGTRDTIGAVPRDAVWEHYREHYRPDTLVVTAAGNVDHDELCARLLASLEQGGWELALDAAPRPRRATRSKTSIGPGERRHVDRPGEQSHVLVGAPGLALGDRRRFVMSVLSTILGGGMSSRLFQQIREQRGLAYTTYGFASSYCDAGTFGMYAACAPRNVTEVEKLMIEQLDRLASERVPADELLRAQGQLTGGLVLGIEDTASRMSRLGRAEISLGELYSIDESLAAIRSVTAAQIQELGAELAAAARSRVVVGPTDS